MLCFRCLCLCRSCEPGLSINISISIRSQSKHKPRAEQKAKQRNILVISFSKVPEEKSCFVFVAYAYVARVNQAFCYRVNQTNETMAPRQWLRNNGSVEVGNEIIMHFLLSFISILDFKPLFVPIEANLESFYSLRNNVYHARAKNCV